MCRLLGYVARRPIPVREAFGPDWFADFTALTRLHADGWGMAWYDGDQLARSVAPTCAASDVTYQELSEKALGAMGMLHLRWATDGLAVGPANTHPFLADGLALAHNGNISPIGDLDRMLTPASRSALAGTTDSERYFRLVLQQVEATGDEVAGVRSAVEALRAGFPRSSLNALVLTPRRLIAVHASSSARPPLTDLQALYPDFAEAPLDHATAYFQMRYRADANAVVVTSTGVAGGRWTDLEPDSLLVIDRDSLAVQQVALSVPAAQ